MIALRKAKKMPNVGVVFPRELQNRLWVIDRLYERKYNARSQVE